MTSSKLITRDSHSFFILLSFDINVLRRRLFSSKTFFYLAICFILFRSILINNAVEFGVNAIMKALLDENVINVDHVFSSDTKIIVD